MFNMYPVHTTSMSGSVFPEFVMSGSSEIDIHAGVGVVIEPSQLIDKQVTVCRRVTKCYKLGTV